MTPVITLEYTGDGGEVRRAVVRGARFHVGRADDNDLVIKDASLSRRHALIEILSDRPYLSDCGSSNGTRVNGQPVTDAVELYDGDRVVLGNSCELVISIGRAEEAEEEAPAPAAEQPPARAEEHAAAPNNAPPKSSVPVIAGAAVGIILLTAVILLALSLWKEEGRARDDDAPDAAVELVGDTSNATPAGGADKETAGDGLKSRAALPANVQTEPAQEGGAGASDDEQIGRAVRRVMSRISADESPYISEQGLKEVAARVRAYRGSAALAERLRVMSRGCSEVTALARSNNIRSTLLAYAALAQADGGGDPVTAARQMTPKLLTLRATFGTETANSALLLVAAYPYPFDPPIGSQARTPHPLASKLQEVGGKRSQVETSVARSVWFLRERGAINSDAYDLVVRLLAVGVIAQNPRQHGVESDPLFC